MSSRLLNRRQSFVLAAWAVLAAGCGARPSHPQGRAAQSDAPRIGPPKLGEGLSDPVARRFYEQRGGKPAWTAALAAALTGSFDEARRHGLNPTVFAVKRGAGDDPNQQDVAMTRAALRYARALAFGFVDPRNIEKVFTLERNQVDLAAGLEQALAENNLPGWLASLAPSDDEYQALSAAYLAAAGHAEAATKSAKAAPCQDERRKDAPARDAPGIVTSTPDTSPPGTSPQDTSPQDRPTQDSGAKHAPTPDAAPDASTKDSLGQATPTEAAPSQVAPTEGAPLDAGRAGTAAAPPNRARQLAANLERRRWISRSPPATRIDVNTASCVLTYVRPGNAPFAARAVCGKTGHETPSIQGAFRRLVANPSWRVPMDIARKEIFPKGGGYMRRANMRVVDGRVIQGPGPHSSLGLVKFDVADPYAIYLHDTPSKSLFALPERHRSHGCVRVQNAVGFARLIAAQAGKTAAFDKALASGKTREVDIGGAIPVRLLYHTAFAGESGEITFVPDVYGWNEKLATILGWGPAAAGPGAQEPDPDIGP